MYLLTNNVFFYPAKLSMFYNVQTTNLTFVDKTKYIQQIDIALRNYQ